MTREEVYTNIDKIKVLEQKVNELENKLDEKMREWEDLMIGLENF